MAKAKTKTKTGESKANCEANSYLGGLKFPAQEYDLASMPDNGRAASDAADMMPWVRMAAIFLKCSDEELEANVRATGDGGMEEWLAIAENIGAVLDAKRQDVELLQAGSARLLVVLERIVGKDALSQADHSRASRGDKLNLSRIRARLPHRNHRMLRLAITPGKAVRS